MRKRLFIGMLSVAIAVVMFGCSSVPNVADDNGNGTTADTTAPNTPIVSGTTPAVDTTPTWTWNTVVDAVNYRHSYTNGSNWTETTNTDFTPSSELSLGNHTLYVQAVDSAGNWSSSGSNTIEVLPIFTEINPGSLTGVSFSSIDLGDIDEDGDIDLILIGDAGGGIRVSMIYQNNGNGSFGEINLGSLTGVKEGSIKLGDINTNGFLDLILTGDAGGGIRVSIIYTNDGSGSFTEINTNSLTNVFYSSIDLGDIDTNGTLDLIITGYNGSTYVSIIYTNNGSGSFTEINTNSLTNVGCSSIDLGDIDNDDDIDLIITGNAIGSILVSIIYTNNGSGSFGEISPGSLSEVSSGSIKLGDIDNDGYLDLIITGYDGSANVSKIYQNDESGGFTEINPGSLTNVSDSSIDLGDINNDGDMDLIITGYDGDDLVSMIYTNNGSGSFGEINPGTLTAVDCSSIKLGDIDNDGDLDLILTGNGSSGLVSKIYRNNTIN